MITEILKYVFGFILAIAILIAGGFATALYLMNRISALPPKPVFANDQPAVKAQVPPSQTSEATQASLEETSPIPETNQETPQPTPKAEESSEPLPPGAYKARVTWKQGLILRNEPTTDAERTGGVAFNKKVIVLDVSNDKEWQKIRLEDSEQEGWVKAGNTKQIDEQDDSQTTEATEQ